MINQKSTPGTTYTDPREYDVLITDIDHGTLQHEIAEVVGIPYHSPSSKATVGTRSYLPHSNGSSTLGVQIESNNENFRPSTYLQYNGFVLVM